MEDIQELAKRIDAECNAILMMLEVKWQVSDNATKDALGLRPAESTHARVAAKLQQIEQRQRQNLERLEKEMREKRQTLDRLGRRSERR